MSASIFCHTLYKDSHCGEEEEEEEEEEKSQQND